MGERFDMLGEEVYRRAKIEEERLNTARADEAYNAVKDAQIGLESGEGGFMSRKGGAVVAPNFRKEYLDKMDEAIKKASGGLANDRQREVFTKHANVARRQFNEGLSRHIGHQADVYQRQTHDASLDVEQRAVVSRWSDLNAVEASMARMNLLIDREAERSGWSDEMRADAKLKAESKVHTAVIGQALASGNMAFAQRYYESNKDGIDPNTAKALQRAVEDGTQKQLFNGYQRAYLDAQNSGKGLSALEQAVTNDKVLDEARQNVLLGRIQNRRAVLAHQAQAAQDRWERQVTRSLDQVRGEVLAGGVVTADQLGGLLNATKGTPLANEVEGVIKLSNATNAFRLASPVGQEQMLTQGEAAWRDDPTKMDRKVLTAWRSIHEHQRREVKENPIGFAVKQGLVDVLPPIDLSKPEQSATALAQRFSIARDVRAKYPDAPLKPLTPEEATLLSETLKKAGPEQQSAYFAQLSKASGNDFSGYKAMMQQIAPDSPATALAGIFAGRNTQTDKAKSVSDYILRGGQILHPNKKEDGTPTKGMLPMPVDKDMMGAFSSYEKNAYAGSEQTRNAVFQAAKQIYAARSVEEGDFSGELKSKRWQSAIELATGGIDTYKGKAVVLPYGYDGSMFRDGLSDRIDALIASGRVDEVAAQKIRSLPLEQAGDGRYVFKAGDRYLVGNDKKPLLIDFNVAPPTAIKRKPSGATGMSVGEAMSYRGGR